MDLPNLKELRALLQLCRKQGVEEITLGPVSIKFGDLPLVAKDGELVQQEEALEMGPDGIPLPPGITLEQMIDYSSRPDPLVERLGKQ